MHHGNLGVRVEAETLGMAGSCVRPGFCRLDDPCYGTAELAWGGVGCAVGLAGAIAVADDGDADRDLFGISRGRPGSIYGV